MNEQVKEYIDKFDPILNTVLVNGKRDLSKVTIEDVLNSLNYKVVLSK